VPSQSFTEEKTSASGLFAFTITSREHFVRMSAYGS
jgi:hypothetical protein